MTTTAIIFFLLAALFGTILLAAVIKNKPTLKPVAILHGAAAIIGILILATYIAAGHYSYLLIASLAIFGVAAIGGFTMFAIDISKKPIPKVFAIVHPLLALTALTLLVVYALQ